jgi:hypothetical protein
LKARLIVAASSSGFFSSTVAHAHRIIKVRDRHILIVANTFRRQIELSAYAFTEGLRQRRLSAEELSEEDVRSISTLISAKGVDMGQFPTAAHLAARVGMAPGNHESAGKRKSGKMRKGSRWLRAALVNPAHAAEPTKDTALGAR